MGNEGRAQSTARKGEIKLSAEEYLERIKKLDEMISNRRDDYQRRFGRACELGGFSESERVRASKDPRKNQKEIAEYIDIEREIWELEAERSEIIRTIERLPCEEYKIIYRLYVQGIALKAIACQLDMSYSWVKKKKKDALRHVQRMLDEKRER